jgi:PASTA domain
MSRMLPRFAVFAVCLPLAIVPPGLAFAQGKASPGRVRVAGPARVSPELMQILKEWYANTRKIERLEGYHWKYTYDSTFNIEKRAVGRFYYQSPDKGRIDIQSAKISAGAKSVRKDKRRKPFTLQADREEKWLSNGKKIYQIDPVNKKAYVYPIPDKAQGRNIMDGPLPFLLGMPPEKALARYRLQIVKDHEGRPWNTKTEVRLKVYPRWKSDAANYREAQVKLNKQNHFLPDAVQMIDPGGNRETVYVFSNMSVNKNAILDTIFGRKWWEIDLRAYKVEYPTAGRTANTGGAPKRGLPKDMLPNVAGHTARNAQDRLTKLGLKVEFVNGRLASRKEEVGLVESQFPQAYTRFRPGQKVILARYVDPNRHLKTEFRKVPNLRYKHYTAAQKELESLGFKVELRKGSVTRESNLLYRVQYQYPLYDGKTITGSKFILTLYVAEKDLPKSRTAAKP